MRYDCVLSGLHTYIFMAARFNQLFVKLWMNVLFVVYVQEMLQQEHSKCV